MKVKKIASKAVAVGMSLALLAGCSGGQANQSESTADASGATKENTNPIVTPAGSYSFSLFVDDSNKNTQAEWMFSYLEKQTGIKVDLKRYPYDVAQEKLPLELNSGSYEDCIGGWTISQNDVLNYGVNQQVYIPLDKYFKKSSPQIESILKLPGVKQAMTAPDGHIYSVPYVLEAPLVDFEPLINQKWLTKLGLSMPKTTEEFENVLKAFKTKDPNGNGKADEIPFSASPDNKHLSYLAGYFGMSLADDGFTMDGDKLVFGANTKSYKAFIEWMAKLNSEGLLDNELFTQNSDQWKAKGANNQLGCTVAYGTGDFSTYDQSKAPDYAALPVLSSPDCKNPVYLANSVGNTVLNTQVVITDKAKNPELICRWWDNVFKLENSIQISYGPIGVAVEKVSDGKYRQVDPNTLSKADQAAYSYDNLWAQSLPHFLPLDFKIETSTTVYPEKDEADKVLKANLTKPIPTAWVSTDDAGTYSDTETAVKNYIQQKQAQWISGQADVDKEWDDYCSQLDKLGLKKLISIRQKSVAANTSGSSGK